MTLSTDGWIWSFTGRARLSNKQLQEYLDEGERCAISCQFLANITIGDCVHWFRAEAEKLRWQEEWEIRQADYIRCIRFFRMMAEIWKCLVKDSIADISLVQHGKNAMLARNRICTSP